MRSVDRAVPTINPDRPAVEPFPAILHIGIERQPIPVYVWDDGTAVWDDINQAFRWDDRADFPYQRFELWCHFYGLTVTSGNPDDNDVFESAHLEMTLDNRDGSLSAYDASGRLVDWQPGSPLDIWANYAGEDFWLFSGRITAWREMTDGTLEVEAYDAFSFLNQFMGVWTPGTTGQTPAARLTSICTRAGYKGTKRFATGDVTLLTRQVDDLTALEVMQLVASSDGGALFCDADGTVVYEPRTWITGRTDQPAVPVLSDNYCEVERPVWETVMLTSDDAIINVAPLTNIDTPPVAVEARNEISIQRHGANTFPNARNEELWQTNVQGETLAEWIVNQKGDHYLRLEQALMYLHDRRFDLWPVALDLRIGDLVEWVHEQPPVDGTQLIALTLTVNTVIHDVTPDAWITTFRTTRAIDHREFQIWDEAVLTWDDPDPRNVWAI